MIRNAEYETVPVLKASKHSRQGIQCPSSVDCQGPQVYTKTKITEKKHTQYGKSQNYNSHTNLQ